MPRPILPRLGPVDPMGPGLRAGPPGAGGRRPRGGDRIVSPGRQELNPRHAAIVYDLGYALQLQGDGYEAINQYRRAIALNPRHAYAYYNLGFLLQTKGYQEGAIDNYEKAASIDPDNPYIYYNLARIFGRAVRHRRRPRALREGARPRARPSPRRGRAQMLDRAREGHRGITGDLRLGRIRTSAPMQHWGGDRREQAAAR